MVRSKKKLKSVNVAKLATWMSDMVEEEIVTEEAECCLGDYLWLSASCLLLLPDNHLRVDFADSRPAMELSPTSTAVVRISRRARAIWIFRLVRRVMPLNSGRNGLWLGKGFWVSFSSPETATCSHQHCSLGCSHPSSSLGCLQPYLESHRGLRWDGAISRKCTGISFLEKKKGPWHEKQNGGFRMLITAPFIRQLY